MNVVTGPGQGRHVFLSAVAWLSLSIAVAASATVGCNQNAPPAKVPGDETPALPAITVDDAGFAGAVHRLLREGERTAERSALLAGVVRLQMTHAAAQFAAGDDVRGTRSVVGALYLLRVGESRPDMFDATSVQALTGAIERFSARGDEGRALALMLMQLQLLPPTSVEHQQLRGHIAALRRWAKETRTGGDMQRLAADKRSAVGRTLLEPNEESLAIATRAVHKWIGRAIEYEVKYQLTRALPPRSEVPEMFRATQSGGETMAALFLRHGQAREAVETIEKSAAGRIIPPAFFTRLKAVAEDDTAEDWRLLARDVARASYGDEDRATRLSGELLEAALWGISLEAYRRDPTSLAIGHLLAGQLINLGMPEVAPHVLRDALGAQPSAVSLSSAMSLIADALADQYATGTTAVARRTFAASRGLLDLAKRDELRGKLTPSASQLRRLMASVELRSGQVDAARPLLLQALDEEPTIWGFTMLGALERQVGNLTVALAHAKRAMALPENGLPLDAADSRLLAFEVLRDMGKQDEAADALERTLAIVLQVRKRGTSPTARLRAERLLARVLDGYGDRASASRAHERALEIATRHRQMLGPTVRRAVGRALTYKDITAARAALQKGIKGKIEAEDLVHGALCLMLLERELGEAPDGKVDRILLDAVDGDEWTSQLARWARGMLNDEQLRATASKYSERIEAEFYISMRAQGSGQAAATEGLKRVAATPLIDLVEVRIARDRLAPKLQAKIPAKYRLP